MSSLSFVIMFVLSSFTTYKACVIGKFFLILSFILVAFAVIITLGAKRASSMRKQKES